MFQVTSPMLNLLQMKGLFGGQAVEDGNLHILNFVDVFLPFMMWDISHESIRLWLFSFSLISEATLWLLEFPQGLITSWAKLKVAFTERFFPLTDVEIEG